MWTTATVEEALHKHGEFPATLAGFMDLYDSDRELFFQLACIGVEPGAAPWMKEAAIMGAYLRALASGFLLEGEGSFGSISSCVNAVPDLPLSGVSLETVRTFMRSLDGFPTERYTPEKPGERIQGRAVSEAQVNYHLGMKQGDAYENTGQTYFERKLLLSGT